MRLSKILLTLSASISFLVSNGFARDLTYIDSVLNPAQLHRRTAGHGRVLQGS